MSPRRLLVCAILWSVIPLARSVELPAELAIVPEPSARVLEIDGAIRSQFDAAVRDYDLRLAKHPEDVSGAVMRCKFMDEFAATYEYASFVDSVYDDSEQCYAQLAERSPAHPEVVLAQLERTYGEERFEAGLRALAGTNSQSWTSGQMARLHTMLASAAETMEDKRALQFAKSALHFDEAADVRLIIAEQLARQGNKDELIRVLTSPADGHDAKDAWYPVRKMELLADAGARNEVLQIFAGIEQHESLDVVAAARALRKVGAIEAARDAFARIDGNGSDAQRVAAERFRFELDYGTSERALTAYETWRNAGWDQDPLGINRLTLLLQAPFLPLRARDLLGLLAFAVALIGLAVVAAMPVAFVHYRGLARRARNVEPYPTGGWRLRHAWMALFAYFAASLVAVYCAGPVTLSVDASSLWGIDASPGQIAQIAFIGEMLMFALLAPIGLSATRAQPRWWGEQWPLLQSIGIGASIAVILRVPLLLSVLMASGESRLGGVQQELWQLLEFIRDAYGPATAVWLVVLAAPVIEELMFRGVLLRAFAAHVSFGWANVIQALLFAAIHFDLRAAPMLFAVGLIAGYLARRSGGLLAPMILHFVFNLIAALVFVF
jgi:membrane protease YdiL (CAAX protease family)